MFLGHFAVGLAAKRLAPTVSLGALFLACQLADLVWPVFVLLGLERVEVEPGATAVTPLRFWTLAGFLALAYAASLLGPPPPDARTVAWAGNAMWLFVLWGFWIDRHRAARLPAPAPAEAVAA